MLSFIARLPEEDLREVLKEQGTIAAADLYRMILENWLFEEIERAQPKGAPPMLSKDDCWNAVNHLALCLWAKTESTVGVDELTEETARAVESLAALQMQPDQAAHQIGSGTLLVRDAEGNFSFIHQSVLEWLVANQASEALKKGESPETLTARKISSLNGRFF